MAKRLKVGIIFSYDKEWVAGAYYILNLIHALRTLADSEKPELHILYHTDEEAGIIRETGYEYLCSHKLDKKDLWASYSVPERVINKISRLFSGKDVFYREQTRKRLNLKLDVLFPASFMTYFSEVENKLFWIPDFQEHFLPEFFSEQEITIRKNFQDRLVKSGAPIVFSSNDARSHFQLLYPTATTKTFVLRFAVSHPAFREKSIPELLDRYRISKPFFFCPNQVWAHKNHRVVLKAVKKLKMSGKDPLVLFSGKETDYRNPTLFKELQGFISQNDLGECVRFLGFIDRTDQLALMNNAICVIQPSLFEGWSTVVEDAKAMGQFVIASDLAVHREQLKENVLFFDPKDPEQLALYMTKLAENVPARKGVDYNEQVKKFGKAFVEILNESYSHSSS